MMHLQKSITAKRAIPLVLLLLFFNALIATFTCGALVACRAYAATQPADADALGLTAQDSIPISAALSDDGVDYGWLYRKGNYWFRVSDYPRTEPRSQYAVMATDGECTFMMSDFMAQYGEPPDSDAQLHFSNVCQDFYSDGVLVFECVNSFRLDYMVAYGEQGVWWGHGASSVCNTAVGLGAPDS